MVGGGFAFAAGTANVIMQLSQLPVGRGVAESTVESGRVDTHPIKRLRTTFTFLVIAWLGTEADRVALRREVNRSHRPVHSAASDPVAYNAFDPALQLWVAACLYRGFEMGYHLIYGDPGDLTADILYHHGARLGTTLQVTEAMWPPDRAAFEDYWQAQVEHIEMDDVTRAYLYKLASLGVLPQPIGWALAPLNRFLTAGFLPEPFRTELGLGWGRHHQHAFNVMTAVGAAVTRRLPRPLREFPFNVYLWDARRRIRTGQPIV